MESFKILVLTPPQDIELKILSLRSDIFSQYGYISALVLPVMVPFCSVHPDTTVKDLKKAFESSQYTGFTMETSKLVEISGSLFIKFRECKALSDLIAGCRNLLLSLGRNREHDKKTRGSVCFPFYTGFFLARNEQGISIKEMDIKIPDPRTLTFKKFSISLLNIAVYSGLDTWWENIDWEILFEVKSRKTALNKNNYSD
jgi:hypothetical protein